MREWNSNNPLMRSMHWCPEYILKYNIYTYSHGFISHRILASSSSTLWGSAGHLLSNVHNVLSINLNLDVYSTIACHLHYTKSPCSLPINHWNHVQKAYGIISGNSLCFFSPLSFLYLRFPRICRSTVCFATGARNARLRNNSLHDMVRNKTGHTALQIENMCPVYTW